ncbi:hypothetical protein AFGD_003930 [Aspergillus flavus]|nr:hypothetical protein AFGD_003930 [Aspergillus flavus]
MTASKTGVDLSNPGDLTLKKQLDLLEASGAVKRFDSHPFVKNIIDSRSLLTRKDIEVGPDHPTTTSQLWRAAAKNNTLVVGGAVVKNLSLLLAKDQDTVAEVPLRALPAVTKPTPKANSLLIAPVNADHLTLLLSPPSPTSYFQFTSHVAPDPVRASSFADEATDADTSMPADIINGYSLSGDLENFWGIKGLTGKLFSDFAFDAGKNKPLSKLEHSPLAQFFPHIDLDPIKQLPINNVEFTYTEADNDILYKKGLRLEGDVLCTGHLQPVADMLRRIYGDKDAPSKLHVSAHLSDERDWTKAPKITKLILSATLVYGKLKVWDFLAFDSVDVQILALQKDKQEKVKDDKDKDESNDAATEAKDEKQATEPGSKAGKVADKATEKVSKATDITSKASDYKAQKKAEVTSSQEVSKKATKESTEKGKENAKDDKQGEKETKEEDTAAIDEKADQKAPTKPKKTWEFGLCILGTGSLINLPKATKPLWVKYRMARDPQETTKALYKVHITAEDWKNAFGVKNLNLTEPDFTASFEAGSFASTAQLNTTANVSFADIKVELQGKLSRDDSYLLGQVGTFTYSQLLQAYAQIRGDRTPELSPLDAYGNDLKFDDVHLRLSRDMIDKALELSGKVTFNKHYSTNAAIKIGSAGLAIHGDVTDFKIEGTEITVKKAALDIEIGAKPPKIEKTNQGEKEEDEKEKEKESKAIEDAPKEKAANSKAKTPDSIDPSAENDKIEKKEEAIDKNLRNRKSKFSVTGDIDYSGRNFRVGLFYGRQAQTKKREWLVYGIVDRFNLSELFHNVKDTDFDFTLKNVALVAASKGYVDNGEINVKGYTIKDGISLWATIEPPMPIAKLNVNHERSLLALKLAVNYSQGIYTVGLEMPETFSVYSPKEHPKYGLEKFTAGMEVATDPKLTLGATLKIFMPDQEPLDVEIMVKGGMVNASASLRTTTPWINPFNVSKHIILEEIGGESGFDYATVAEQGPSDVAIIAKLQIEETKAGVAMKVSETDGEMLSVSVDKFNVCKIIRYAGQLTEIKELQKIGNGEDVFIINQGSLYISSGVRIGGKSYPRGISASASVTIFDQTGQFDARVDDSGFTGKGSIDRFKLGALEVSAASDVTKPATFDIAMTQDEQKIKVDGMIHYHDIKLLALVDADLQKLPPMFNAHLLLEFTGQYKIDFFFNASLGSVKSLSEVNLDFSALIEGDLFDLICDGVNSFLDRTQKLVDQGFDSAKQKLENELSEKNKVLKSLQEDLERRDQGMKEHEKKRQCDLVEAKRKVKENNEKLAALEKDVKDAKKNKEDAEKRYRDELKKQQEERNEIVARKRREYEEKPRKLEKDERDYRTRKENLEATHRTNYGEKETALAWFKQHKEDTWNDFQKAQKTMHDWDDKWNNASWLDKSFDVNLKAGVNKAKWDLSVALAAWVGVTTAEEGFVEFTHWPAYNALMQEINSAIKDLTKAVTAVQEFRQGGVDAFICAVVNDEDRKVKEKEDQLNLLLDSNSKEQKAIRDAEGKLDANKSNILEIIQENDNKIKELEENNERKVLQQEYDNKRAECTKLENAVHTVEHVLNSLQADFDNGIIAIKGEVTAWRDFLPRITRIEAKASSNALKSNEPIFVIVTAVYKGITKTFGVQWTPNSKSKPYDLYKAIGDSAKGSFPVPAGSS